MYPPSQGLSLDIEALSGICGSISIACWIVVFSPQIIENFRKGSAEALSITFIVIWLAGDIFNILGAVLQGVLPTMTILAVYYTLADIVLLGQCFYYRGFTLRDEVKKPASGHVEGGQTEDGQGERRPLLGSNDDARSRSRSAFRERLRSMDGTHLSPVTPLHPTPDPKDLPNLRPPASTPLLQAALFNLTVILLVCLAGIFGWYLSTRSPHHSQQHHHHHHHHHDPSPAPPSHSDAPKPLAFNPLGQVFGYICAALYLGSRVPQLLLNHRRKSTDGVSMLFFLFACIGNLTYVMSILAYSPAHACARPDRCEPGEAARIYTRYVAVNFSWLLGSLGTLFLDAGVFVQFFMYRRDEDDGVDGRADEDEGVSRVGREERRTAANGGL